MPIICQQRQSTDLKLEENLGESQSLASLGVTKEPNLPYLASNIEHLKLTLVSVGRIGMTVGAFPVENAGQVGKSKVSSVGKWPKEEIRGQGSKKGRS